MLSDDRLGIPAPHVTFMVPYLGLMSVMSCVSPASHVQLQKNLQQLLLTGYIVRFCK